MIDAICPFPGHDHGDRDQQWSRGRLPDGRLLGLRLSQDDLSRLD
jgi:hypothetical protein